MNLLNNQDNSASAEVGSTAPSSSSAPPPPAASAPDTDDDQGNYTGGLKVSLMPEGEEEAGSGLRRWLIIVIGVLFLETLLIGGGYLYMSNLEAEKNEALVDLQQRIDKVKSDIKAVEKTAEEAATFDSRARVAGDILDKHLFWTKFFKYLGTQTKQNVSYLSFSGDYISRTISLDAVGRTYRDVAEQIVLLRENPIIEDVMTASASARVNEMGVVEGVSFSLLITFHPEVWLPATENITDDE